MSRSGATVPLTINQLHRNIKHFEESKSKVEISTKSIKPDIVVQRWSQFEDVYNHNHKSPKTNGVSSHTTCNDVRQSDIKRTNGIRRTSGPIHCMTSDSQYKPESLLQVPRYERRLPNSRTGIGLQTRHIEQDPGRYETRSVIEKQSPRLSNNLLHPHWSVADLPSDTNRDMEPKPLPVKNRPQARNVLTQVLKKRAAVEHPSREKQHSSNGNVQLRHNNGAEHGSPAENEKRNSVFDRVKEFESIDKCPNTNSNRAVKDDNCESDVASRVSLNPRVVKCEPQNLHHTYENQDFKEKEGNSPQIAGRRSQVAPKPSIKPKNIHIQNAFQKKKKMMSSSKVHTYEEVADDEYPENDPQFAEGGLHGKQNCSIPAQPRNIRDGAKSPTGGRKAHRERSIVIVGPNWKKDQVGRYDQTNSNPASPPYEDVYEGDDSPPEIIEPSNLILKPKKKDKSAIKVSVYEEVYAGEYENKKFQIAPPESPTPGSKPLPPPKPKITKNPPPYFILERNSADGDTLQSPDNSANSNGVNPQSLFHFQSYKTPYVLADTSGMIDEPLSPNGRRSKKKKVPTATLR